MTAGDFHEQLSRRATVANVEFSKALAEQMESYYRLLVRWNASINLTALPLDPLTDEALDRLLIEPVSTARFLRTAPVWFDLGSGGGSPAIPLKLARPGGRLTMVESKERKAAFLREAVRTLNLESAYVEAERIESVAADSRLAGTADLVTVRAVRVDPPLLGAARTLLRFGGQAVFFGAKRADLPVMRGFEAVEPTFSESPSSRFVLLTRTGF